jgi:hypothetical protein
MPSAIGVSGEASWNDISALPVPPELTYFTKTLAACSCAYALASRSISVSSRDCVTNRQISWRFGHETVKPRQDARSGPFFAYQRAFAYD